jgi:hypothetical protein
MDDLVRRAMKSLDDRAPSGYFDSLVSRTLARLEDDKMETTSGKSQDSQDSNADAVKQEVSAATGVPKRDDDSGLHDIRSLANSAKQRAAAKRTSQMAIVPDEDILASTSGAWKNIALPEPAKMVSLPDLAAKADLPSKKEVKEAERQHREAQKKKAAEAASAEASDASSRNVPAVGTEPVKKVEKTAAAVDIAEAREKKKAAVVAPKAAPGNRKQTIAVIGGAIAAVAAAGIFFVVTSGKKTQKYEVDRDHDVAALEVKHQSAPVVVAAPPPPAPAAPSVTPIPEAAPEPAPPPPVEVPKADKHAAKAETPKKAVQGDDRALNEATTKAKPVTKAAAAGKAEDSDPSFDALLKEAGVDGKKKDAAPVLAKKKLTGDDFMSAMKTIEGKANACYQGTQGNAMVHVAIETTGKIAKVSVAGPFAGTPVANCVANAVRSVSFPPWDGAPESFNYSFLLSE